MRWVSPAFNLAPFVVRNDARQQVVGKHALGALVVAIDGEGDALMQKRQIGGLLALAQFLGRKLQQCLKQSLIVLARRRPARRTSRRRRRQTGNCETGGRNRVSGASGGFIRRTSPRVRVRLGCTCRTLGVARPRSPIEIVYGRDSDFGCCTPGRHVNPCHSDPRAKARDGGIYFFSLPGFHYSASATASAPP